MLKNQRKIVAEVCQSLQELQRGRSQMLKTKLMQENRRRAYVCSALGYYAGQDEDERKKRFKEADEYISKVLEDGAGDRCIDAIILDLSIPMEPLGRSIEGLEKKMRDLAKQLHVAKWAEGVRGFGTLGLAKIVGETGDLFNYKNPAKVWRRMGCAPYQDHMAKTWRIEKWRPRKLSAEEWEEYGYCPRRRSIVFVISEGLVKQNDGAYRKRYDEAKARGLLKWPQHVDKKKGTSMHAHSHAMLLCAKLLLKDLWIEWTQ